MAVMMPLHIPLVQLDVALLYKSLALVYNCERRTARARVEPENACPAVPFVPPFVKLLKKLDILW